MKGKLVLNLGRVDFVAAAIEHVFFAVMDGDVALGVHAAQIAGFPPAIGEVEGVGLWIVPVAGDDVGAFFPDFAALPDGQFLALLVAGSVVKGPVASVAPYPFMRPSLGARLARSLIVASSMGEPPKPPMRQLVLLVLSNVGASSMRA